MKFLRPTQFFLKFSVIPPHTLYINISHPTLKKIGFIPQMIENAIVIEEEPNEKGNDKSMIVTDIMCAA